MDKDQYLLSSVYNSLQIMDLLSRREGLGVAEISKAMGMGKASVFRILYTLEKAGYITKSAAAKYDLGIKFANYGSLVVDRQSIVHVSKPYLEKLRDTFGETAHLSMLTSTGKMVFLSKHYSGSSLQMYSRIGEEREAFYTASGKAMLAHIERSRAEEYARNYDYKALTSHSITSAEQLMSELEEIRREGYSVDREETELGLVCFSAPIFDHNGKCIAAVSLSGPTIRMYNGRETMIPGIMQACKDISRALGYEAKRHQNN